MYAEEPLPITLSKGICSAAHEIQAVTVGCGTMVPQETLISLKFPFK